MREVLNVLYYFVVTDKLLTGDKTSVQLKDALPRKLLFYFIKPGQFVIQFRLDSGVDVCGFIRFPTTDH